MPIGQKAARKWLVIPPNNISRNLIWTYSVESGYFLPVSDFESAYQVSTRHRWVYCGLTLQTLAMGGPTIALFFKKASVGKMHDIIYR
jgi:hypothetical protein